MSNSDLKVAFFDMDNTLIDADCEITWKLFAVKHGMVDASELAINDRYFEDYDNGCLDFNEYIRFIAKDFKGHTLAEMDEICRRHFEEYTKPAIYPGALKLVQSFKERHIPVILLTATNLTLAKPLTEFFGFDLALGTQLEVKDGVYTGEMTGVYASQEGKVYFAQKQLEAMNLTLANAAYFGDSINDRNILEKVGYPTAVNPSDSLLALAREKHWDLLDFRDGK